VIVNVAAEADALRAPPALDLGSIIGIAVGVSIVEAACPAAALCSSSGALMLDKNEKANAKVFSKRELLLR
jgi:xanthosine utilization system XapX-like protein